MLHRVWLCRTMPDYAWSNAKPMAIGMRPVHWLIYYISHLIPNYSSRSIS